MNKMKVRAAALQICLAVTVWWGATPAMANEATPSNQREAACPALLNHEFQVLRKADTETLCRHAGQVLLVVNTASRCGYTPQFKGLEALYQQYQSRGFTVLGFPSNDFFQELKDDTAIASFCEINYGVTFPMYSKTHVRGDAANPLYRELTEQAGKAPQWNFNKYLIDRNGKVIGHYPSSVDPMSKQLISEIESLL